MKVWKETCRAVGYQLNLPPQAEYNTRFTSWKVPNLKTFIQDEQIVETACNEQAKTVCTYKLSYNKNLKKWTNYKGEKWYS